MDDVRRPPTLRRCRRCNGYWLELAFRSVRGGDGLDTQCRPCRQKQEARRG